MTLHVPQYNTQVLTLADTSPSLHTCFAFNASALDLCTGYPVESLHCSPRHFPQISPHICLHILEVSQLLEEAFPDPYRYPSFLTLCIFIKFSTSNHINLFIYEMSVLPY